MTDYNIKLNKEELVGLLTESDALSELLESTLNQVLEAQMTEHIGAERYKHTDERQGYRNGSRVRTLSTRVAHLPCESRKHVTADLAANYLNAINGVNKRLS